jgi:hypothetical protein
MNSPLHCSAPFFGPSSHLRKVSLSYCGIFVRMVARYAPPISYNFLNLINLDPKQTIFAMVAPPPPPSRSSIYV